ncbi:hypothetical protein [Alsobacter sp. R-9]
MTPLRKEDLTAAVEAGIISARQADALADFAAGRAGRARPSDERFVILNNFNELFVAIGLVLLATAAHLALRFAPQPLPFYAALGFAVLSWGIAEVFAFHRPMMLPAIVAALAVCLFAVQALTLSGIAMRFNGTAMLGSLSVWQGQATLIGGLLAVVLRFRVPFLVLPLAGAVAATVTIGSGDLALLVAGLCGVVLLVLAVWFDLQDPARLKRASQFAFWLYVAGSPLTVHPIFLLVLGLQQDGGGIAPLTILAMAAAVTLFGLVMDRRSPVISTLAYLAIAFGTTLSKAGGSGVLVVDSTMAMIGLYVVLLGVGWRSVRRLLFRLLPVGRLSDRLSPVA